MVQEPGAGRGLRRLDDLGVLDAIHRGLTLNTFRRQTLARLEKRLQWYRSLGLRESLEDWVLYLQVLLVGLRADRRRAAARRLALHRRVIVVADQLAGRAARVLSRMSAVPDLRASTVYFLLAPLRLESVLFLMAMTRSKRALAGLSRYVSSLRFRKVAVSGRDLVALGLRPGPSHGRILRRVQAAQLDGEAPTRHQQLALAARLVRRAVRQ
jgi:tRNA nucleotidyltransferase (CCA-adding enzyme)